MGKDLSSFSKIGVTQAILSLSKKTPCLEIALTMFGEISSYPSDLSDFKKPFYVIHHPH